MQCGEDEEDTMGYYDGEDDLEAFSDAGLGCEDGGNVRLNFPPLGKATPAESEMRQCASALLHSLPKCLSAV